MLYLGCITQNLVLNIASANGTFGMDAL